MSALLIDYLGVVARPPGEHARALIEKAVGAQGFWEEYRELRPQTLTGTVDERRFWNRLAARADLPLFDVDDAIAADWAGHLDFDCDVLAAVDKLRALGRTVAVMADLPTDLSVHLRRRLPWLGSGVAAIFSCDIGMLVTDPRAFDVALEVLDASAAKATFVSRDQSRLAAAAEHGLCVREYRDPTDLEEFL